MVSPSISRFSHLPTLIQLINCNEAYKHQHVAKKYVAWSENLTTKCLYLENEGLAGNKIFLIGAIGCTPKRQTSALLFLKPNSASKKSIPAPYEALSQTNAFTSPKGLQIIFLRSLKDVVKIF